MTTPEMTPQLLLDQMQQGLGPEYEVSLYPDRILRNEYWLVVRRGEKAYQIRLGEQVLSVPPDEVPGLVRTLIDDVRANLP